MKNKLFGIFLILFMFCLSIGLSACGDISAPKTENKEFDEYESIVTSVKENSIDKLGEAPAKKAKAAYAGKNVQPMAVTNAIKDQIVDLAEKCSDKKPSENTSMYRDVFEQTFFIPLICGDAITSHHNANKFYGASVAIHESKQFVMTESVGTSKISYCFSSPESVFGEEMFILMIVDYKSETDFSFQALQFNADYSSIFFAYGNSALEFVNVGKSWSDAFITYTKSNGDSYSINDIEVIDACYDLIEADFTSVDKEKIRNVGKNPQYTLTQAQYEESSRKYFDGIDPVTGTFDVRDGIVFGWMGDAGTCPEELVIPSDVASIYYNFYMPENVKKLTIPANIKNVKIEKLQLEQYENSDMEKSDNPDDPANREMVDCPFKYFEISQNGRKLEEIAVGSGSPLFKVEYNCLYSKDDILLHIPSGSKVTSIKLDASKMSRGAERCLYEAKLTNLKEVDCTVGYGESQDGSARITIDPFAILLENASKFGLTYSFDSVIIRGLQDIVDGNGYHQEDYVLDVKCDFSVKTLELYGEGCVEIRSDSKSMTTSKIIINDGIAGLNANVKAHTAGLTVDVPSSAEWLSIQSKIDDKNSKVNINLPWSKYGIIVNGLYNLLEIRQEEYDPEYNTTSWSPEGQPQIIYHFLELTDEEKEIIEGSTAVNESFKDITYFNAGQGGYDYPTAHIRNYYGMEAAVRVPEIIRSYTVTAFELNNYASTPELGNINVAGVKEIYLPKTLVNFSIYNSDGSAYYVIDKIVYNGTKAKFEEICGGAENVRNMLKFTALIECTDGDFEGQEIGDKETYTFEDANKNTIIINVDWVPEKAPGDEGNGCKMLINVAYNKEEYKLHLWSHGGKLQFGKTDNGAIKYELEVRVERMNNSNSLSVWFNDYMIIDGKPDIPFELKSRIIFDGEINIAHDYQRVVTTEPTCLNSGFAMHTCSVCGHIQKGSEESLEPLGHDGVGQLVEATCVAKQHMHYECQRCYLQYDDNFTGELAPHDNVEYERQEASCMQEGYIKLRCRNCGENQPMETILALGHDFQDIGIAPTCTESGYRQEVCDRCCEIGAYEFLPALAHNYDENDFCENCHDSKLFNISKSEDGWHILGLKDNVLVENLVIPNNLGGIPVVQIEANAFGRNSLNSVDIPGSVKIIGNYAFSDMFTGKRSSLRRVTIGNGVESIGEYAFYRCENLTSIVIPASVETIGQSAFSNCDLLTVYAAANVQPSGWASSWIGGSMSRTVWNYNKAFGATDDGLLWVTNENNTLMISGYCGTGEEIVIPEQIDGKVVSAIQKNAIANNQSLLGIVIHESIKTIETWAINNCPKLTVYAKADELPSGWDSQWIQSSIFVVFSTGDEHGALDNGLDWTETKNNNIVIFRYNGEAESVEIPSQINGKAVTEIYKNTFSRKRSIKNVTISSSVIRIGESAFASCSALEKVIFESGSSLTHIEKMAFEYCGSLKGFTLPAGLKMIGESAFSGCYAIADVLLSVGLEEIGDYAFKDCSSLTAIEVPNSVTSIGFGAFKDCSAIESICLPFVGNALYGQENTHFGFIFGASEYNYHYNYIPELLETVKITGNAVLDNYAFYNCLYLVSVVLEDGVKSVGNNAFYYCRNLKSVQFGGVESIGNEAFKDCDMLSSVMFGDKLATIGNNAFENCVALTSIVIGNNVKNIGVNAFMGCTKLAAVEIGSGVEAIGDSAFSGCDALIDISIPGSVKTIGKSVFAGCTKLAGVEIGSGVETIGDSAFEGCSALIDIVIPNSVTKIGARAFYSTKLERITLPFAQDMQLSNIFERVPDTLKTVAITGGTSIGNSAFAGCSYLENIIIPSSVMYIGNSAFNNCSSLTEIVIPNSVIRVGQSAFNGCNNLAKVNYLGDIAGWCKVSFANEKASPLYYVNKLHINDVMITEVVVPGSVENIGSFAFANCYDITSVLLEDGVKTIGAGAFKGIAITNIEIPDSVTELGSGAFDCDNLTDATIGKGIISFGTYVFKPYTLKNLDYTGDFATWCAIEFKSAIENPMVDANSQIKFTVQGNATTHIRIPNGVTRIGAYAFAGFQFVEVLDIPSSVQSIGEGAFYYCGAFSIAISSGVTRIEENTFWNCRANEVYIPDTVTSIGTYAFRESYVGKIVLPNSVKTIEEYAFEHSHLTSVIIPDSVTFVGGGAFSDCYSLSDVAIGNGLTKISASMFTNCYQISSIIIPSNILSIGGGAFNGCYGLTNVIIESGVTSIGGLAFYDCREITSLEIPKTVTSIGGMAFAECNKLESLTIPFAGEFADGTGATHIGHIFGASGYQENNTRIPASLKTVVLSGSGAIADHAFYGCTYLTTIDLNANTSTVGNYAFYGLTSLTTVIIDGLTQSIGDYAFSGCIGLESIRIGDMVTSIGEYVFDGCVNMERATLGDRVATIGKYAFNGCVKLHELSIGYNKSTPGHSVIARSDLKYVGQSAFMECSNLAIIDYMGTIPQWCGIEFEDLLANPLYMGHNLYMEGELVKKLEIPNEPTSGNNVQNIGPYTFNNCSSLETIIIPESVHTIAFGAFAGCTRLKEIHLPFYSDKLEGRGRPSYLGYIFGAEKYADNAKYVPASLGVVILSGTEIIGEGALYNCGNITTVWLPYGVKEIGKSAFKNCSSLVVIENRFEVTTIGENAFKGCQSLTEAPIGGKVSSIGSGAFNGCIGLTSVNISSSVQTLGEGVFSGCTALQTINCAAESQPSGWDENWNIYCNATIRWSAEW